MAGRRVIGAEHIEDARQRGRIVFEVLPGDMTYAWNAMSYQEKAAAGSGAQVFLLGEPGPLLDKFTVHQRDLPGRPAE